MENSEFIWKLNQIRQCLIDNSLSSIFLFIVEARIYQKNNKCFSVCFVSFYQSNRAISLENKLLICFINKLSEWICFFLLETDERKETDCTKIDFSPRIVWRRSSCSFSLFYYIYRHKEPNSFMSRALMISPSSPPDATTTTDTIVLFCLPPFLFFLPHSLSNLRFFLLLETGRFKESFAFHAYPAMYTALSTQVIRIPLHMPHPWQKKTVHSECLYNDQNTSFSNAFC